MKLSLNPDYVRRHLFSAVVMAALGLWFGYDGAVRYPATPAAELYRSIEKSEAPAGFDLEAFKRQKIQTQYGFSILALLAAAVVGARLYRSYRFAFTFDEAGFSAGGRTYPFAAVTGVDRTRWKSKNILVVKTADASFTLDAWHHIGVADFEAQLPA